MILGSRQTIEDKVIQMAANTSRTPKQLWAEINGTGSPVTIQAVYKAIRNLLREGIVVKAGKKILLNQEWLEKVDQLFISPATFPALADGEAVTYKFNNLSNLDIFWKHTVIGTLREMEELPVFHFDPHEMWIYLSDRKESQEKYLTSFSEKKRFAYMTLGGLTALDKEYKAKYQNEFLEICLKKSDKRNTHLTILGDIVVATTISDMLAEQVDKIYEAFPSADESFVSKLEEAFKDSGPAKIKIEKNKSKAKKLRKQLAKNFFVPKEIVKKFSLF